MALLEEDILVLSAQAMDFKAQDTGEQVKGVQILYVSLASPNESNGRVRGYEVRKGWLDYAAAPAFVQGCGVYHAEYSIGGRNKLKMTSATIKRPVNLLDLVVPLEPAEAATNGRH